MTDISKEDGVILALMEKLEKQRLPRVLALKSKVDRGESLDTMDLAFLEEVLVDARRNKPLIDKHPDWQRFCAHVVHLYEGITEKALHNEEKRS